MHINKMLWLASHREITAAVTNEKPDWKVQIDFADTTDNIWFSNYSVNVWAGLVTDAQISSGNKHLLFKMEKWSLRAFICLKYNKPGILVGKEWY